MPREIISSTEASQILSTERVRCIDAVAEMHHSEIVYETLVMTSDKLKCDFCGKAVRFIHHTIDHMGQNFMDLTCESCAPPGYERLSQQRAGG